MTSRQRTRFHALLLTTAVAAGLVLVDQPASADQHEIAGGPEHVVLIDWDGLDPRYLDQASTPNIDGLIRRGSLATARGTYKTYSNPSRASMATGAYPEVHNNVAYVYDPGSNRIQGQTRFLAAETLAQSLADEGKTVASVQWYIVQNFGVEYGNPEHLYVQPGGSCDRRIDAAIDILHRREVDSGGELVTVPKIPDLLAVYCSDLDSLGHAEGPNSTGMVPLIEEMDAHLGRLIQATKDVGIYGRTTFVLTADHGMTEWNRSLNPQVLAALDEAGYQAEILGSGASPADDTEVIIASAVRVGTISLRGAAASDDGRAEIKAALEALPEIERVIDRGGLRELRASEREGDLVVEPEPPWALTALDLPPGEERGGHGSLREIELPLILSGASVCRRQVPQNPELVDIAPTIAALLGTRPPADAQGRVLAEALRTPECRG